MHEPRPRVFSSATNTVDRPRDRRPRVSDNYYVQYCTRCETAAVGPRTWRVLTISYCFNEIAIRENRYRIDENIDIFTFRLVLRSPGPFRRSFSRTMDAGKRRRFSPSSSDIHWYSEWCFFNTNFFSVSILFFRRFRNLIYARMLLSFCAPTRSSFGSNPRC